MERYVRFIVRHRIAVVVAVLSVTLFLVAQLRYVHLAFKSGAEFPQNQPYVEIQNRIVDLFGGSAVPIIGVVARHGDIFTPAILGKIYRITHALLEVPGVVKTSVFSIAAPNVKAVVAGANGFMDVHPLMSGVPTTMAEIQKLRATIKSDKVIGDNLVSKDGTAAVIVADFDDTQTDRSIAQHIEKIVAPERDDTVVIALAGAPILKAALMRYTAMMAILFPIAVLVIGLIHYEAFRTLQAMFLPLATALLSVVWALGIMGLLRQPMDTWSAITPVVILAVAAGHAVQILKRYYEEYARLGDNQQAVIASVTAVGPAMLTAGLVASGGFGSLVTFGILSVRVFGLLLAAGILSALVIEMTFTPACRCLLPAPKSRELRREEQRYWLDRLLDTLASVVVRQPRTVLVVALIVVGVVGVGAYRMRVDNSFRLWFSPSTQIRKDDALLNRKLPGTATIRILIDGQRPDAIEDPHVLQAMSDLEAFMRRNPDMGGVLSIADHVKRMNQAMHDGNPAYFKIPDSRRLIAEYLLLYGMSAGPNGLSAFVDANYQHAVIHGLSKTDDATFSRTLLRRLQRYAAQRFRGLPAQARIAGGTLGIQTALNDVVVHEKIVNVIQVSLIIFILSALALRSLIGGLFVLLPLGAAVIITLGVMGWSHTWLDMSTAAFTAMGVSIGADFAIYLLFRVREELASAGSIAAAISAALRTSGKAIFFVSSAVALGYMVLLFSGFSVWIRLGSLTALIISVSALASLTLLPSLAVLIQPTFLKRGGVSADTAPSAAAKSSAAMRG